MFSSRFMLFPKKSGGGGGWGNSFSFHFAFYAIFNIKKY